MSRPPIKPIRVDRPFPRQAVMIDIAATPLIEEMNRNGIELDVKYMREIDWKLRRELDDTMSRLHDLTKSTLNPNSSTQVVSWLKEHELEPVSGWKYSRKTGAESCDGDTLAGMAKLHPAIPLMLDAREKSKLISTYTSAFPAMVGPDNRIRTRFGMVTARTARLNSENPNLQNIPMRVGPMIRNAFRAKEGHLLVGGDLSQIEMVWAAELSGDQAMKSVFLNGEDMHVKTSYGLFHDPADGLLKMRIGPGFDLDPAWEVDRTGMVTDVAWGYGELVGWWKKYKKDQAGPYTPILKCFENHVRLPSKVLGFSTLYGTTPEGLQTQIVSAGGPYTPVHTCAGYIEGFFRTYDGVWAWMQEQWSRVLRYGMVWGPFGRVRYIPEGNSALPRVREEAKRQAGNTPIQGGAGDHLKIIGAWLWEVVKEWRRAGIGVWPLLSIHDELIFEVEEEHAEGWRDVMREIMPSAVEMEQSRVPVKAGVSVGTRWGELK